MLYEFNDKMIKISDEEIEKSMKSLEISKDEAIEMWLADHDLEENVEQKELNDIASKVKIKHGAIEKGKNEKKEKIVREVKISDEKKELFCIIKDALINETDFIENVTILNQNKLISVQINDTIFKINISQTRKPKPKS